MKQGKTKIRLAGPTGDQELWQIIAKPMRKGWYGETDWTKKIIYINSRLRNVEIIRSTLLHEVQHATAGQNGSEEFAKNLELNYSRARATFAKLL